jgi:hypothetical protein
MSSNEGPLDPNLLGYCTDAAQFKVMQYLIERGFDPNAKVANRFSAWGEYVWQIHALLGNKQIVEYLKAAGAKTCLPCNGMNVKELLNPRNEYSQQYHKNAYESEIDYILEVQNKYPKNKIAWDYIKEVLQLAYLYQNGTKPKQEINVYVNFKTSPGLVFPDAFNEGLQIAKCYSEKSPRGKNKKNNITINYSEFVEGSIHVGTTTSSLEWNIIKAILDGYLNEDNKSKPDFHIIQYFSKLMASPKKLIKLAEWMNPSWNKMQAIQRILEGQSDIYKMISNII